MKENEINEQLEQLKRLRDEGFLKDEDLLEKLKKIVERKENLKNSINQQKLININMLLNEFSESDILLLINKSMI